MPGMSLQSPSPGGPGCQRTSHEDGVPPEATATALTPAIPRDILSEPQRATRSSAVQIASESCAGCRGQNNRGVSIMSSPGRRNEGGSELVLGVSLQPAEVLLDRTTAVFATVADPNAYLQHWRCVGRGPVCDSSSSSCGFSTSRNSRRVLDYDRRSIQKGRYSCSGSSCSLPVPPASDSPSIDLLPLFVSFRDRRMASAAAAAVRLRFLPAAAASAAVALAVADDVAFYCLKLDLLEQASHGDATARDSSGRVIRCRSCGRAIPSHHVGRSALCARGHSASLPFPPSMCASDSSSNDSRPYLRWTHTKESEQQHEPQLVAQSLALDVFSPDVPSVVFQGPPASWVSVHLRRPEPSNSAQSAGGASDDAQAAGASADKCKFDAVAFPTSLYGYTMGRRFAAAARDSALLLRRHRLRGDDTNAAVVEAGSLKSHESVILLNMCKRQGCRCSCCAAADALLRLLGYDPPTFTAVGVGGGSGGRSSGSCSYIYLGRSATNVGQQRGAPPGIRSPRSHRSREGVWLLRAADSGEPFAFQAVIQLRVTSLLLAHTGERRRRLIQCSGSSPSQAADIGGTDCCCRGVEGFVLPPHKRVVMCTKGGLSDSSSRHRASGMSSEPACREFDVSLVKILLLAPHRTYAGEPTPRVLSRVRRMALSWFHAKKIAMFVERQKPQGDQLPSAVGTVPRPDCPSSPDAPDPLRTPFKAAASAALPQYTKAGTFSPLGRQKQLYTYDRHSLAEVPAQTLQALVADAALEDSFVSEQSELAESLIGRLCDFVRPVGSGSAASRGAARGTCKGSCFCSSCESGVVTVGGERMDGSVIGLRWRRDFLCFEVYVAMRTACDLPKSEQGQQPQICRCCSGESRQKWTLLMHEILQPCVLDVLSVHLTFSEVVRRLYPWLRLEPHLLGLLQQSPEGQKLLASAAHGATKDLENFRPQHQHHLCGNCLRGTAVAHRVCSDEELEQCELSSGERSPEWSLSSSRDSVKAADTSESPNCGDSPAVAACGGKGEIVGAIDVGGALKRLAFLNRPLRADCETVQQDGALAVTEAATGDAASPPAAVTLSKVKQESTVYPSEPSASSEVKRKHDEYDMSLLSVYFQRVRERLQARVGSTEVGASFPSEWMSSTYSESSGASEMAMQAASGQRLPGARPLRCCKSCCGDTSTDDGVVGDTYEPPIAHMLQRGVAAADAVLAALQQKEAKFGKLQRQADVSRAALPGPHTAEIKFSCEYISVTDIAMQDPPGLSLLLTLLFPTQRLLRGRERNSCEVSGFGHSPCPSQCRTGTCRCGVEAQERLLCGRSSSNRPDNSVRTETFGSDELGPLLLPNGEAATETPQHVTTPVGSNGKQCTWAVSGSSDAGEEEELASAPAHSVGKEERPAREAGADDSSGSTASSGRPLAREAGADDSSGSTASSGTSVLWARTCSGGLSLNVISSKVDSSRSSDSDGDGGGTLTAHLPEGTSVADRGETAEPSCDQEPSAATKVKSTLQPCPDTPSYTSDSFGDPGAVEGAALLGELVTSVRDSIELNFGFPVSAEPLEEATVDLYPILKESSLSKTSSSEVACGRSSHGRCVKSAAALAGASGAAPTGQQAHVTEAWGATSEQDEVVERISGMPQQPQQQDTSLVASGLGYLSGSGAAAQRRQFARRRVVSAAPAAGAARVTFGAEQSQTRSGQPDVDEEQKSKPQQAPRSMPSQSRSEGRTSRTHALVGSRNFHAAGAASTEAETLMPPGTTSSRSGSSTPTGVYFDAARQLWRCQWKEDGRLRSKGFAVARYRSHEEARNACIAYRNYITQATAAPAYRGEPAGPVNQPEPGRRGWIHSAELPPQLEQGNTQAVADFVGATSAMTTGASASGSATAVFPKDAELDRVAEDVQLFLRCSKELADVRRELQSLQAQHVGQTSAQTRVDVASAHAQGQALVRQLQESLQLPKHEPINSRESEGISLRGLGLAEHSLEHRVLIQQVADFTKHAMQQLQQQNVLPLTAQELTRQEVSSSAWPDEPKGDARANYPRGSMAFGRDPSAKQRSSTTPKRQRVSSRDNRDGMRHE